MDRETLGGLIDTYYVEFVRANSKVNFKGSVANGPIIKFAFQIDRKAKKTTVANIASIA